MGRRWLTEFLRRLLWKWLRKSGGGHRLFLGICFVRKRGSQGGRRKFFLVDGKKFPAGSGWRPLSGELDYVGRSVAVSPAVSLEGYCEQQRKGAPLGGSGVGVDSANLAFVCCCVFLQTQLIPRLLAVWCFGYSHQKCDEEIAFHILVLSVSFMLPQVHVFKDPEVFVLRRPQREGLRDHWSRMD